MLYASQSRISKMNWNEIYALIVNVISRALVLAFASLLAGIMTDLSRTPNLFFLLALAMVGVYYFQHTRHMKTNASKMQSVIIIGCVLLIFYVSIYYTTTYIRLK
jgi:uncharacterized membrane protein